MDQKWTNLFGFFFLKPAVGIETIAVLAKELRVPMKDPGIDTQNSLEPFVSIA